MTPSTVSTQVDVSPTGAPKHARRVSRLVKTGDLAFYGLTLGCAASIVGLTAWVAYQLFYHSSQARHAFGWSFLFSTEWNPVTGQFGALPFIYGTVVTSMLALLIAVPTGVATAVFLAEMAPPKISGVLAFLVDLLAAVPSVIYGLLAIFLLLPLLSTYVIPPLQKTLGFLPIFSGDFSGASMFSAGIILAVMIIPFVISISREVLLAVPREQREGSYALGSTHWETVWHVVLPYAKRGILGSAFLALARALGETMAVTMVIGNDPQISKSLLARGYTIAAIIANEFAETTSTAHSSALILLGLVLFSITFVINGLARLLVLTVTEGHSHA
jgi:phosphate transport system permease protein